MGRALYSTTYTPVIREPSPSPYEKWSISNPFDPDSEAFFESAQYEAFLPTPLPTTRSNEPPRIDTTGVTTTRSGDVLPRFQISNPMILDSVPHDLPEVESPVSASRSLGEDTEQSNSALSAMADGSDTDDPIRMLSELVTEYRRMRRENSAHPRLSLTEILRQMDEELNQGDRRQPQRYLPPLDYSSSSSGTPSPIADSPDSPIFFPSPPSPPPMSRQTNSLTTVSETVSGPHSSVAESSEQLEDDSLDMVDSSHREVEIEEEAAPASSVPSIPISVPRSHLRNSIHIHRGNPGSFGFDVGLDMSPPPSVSPRLYNWSRTRPESNAHYSPSSYTRRSSYIPITHGSRI
ncbi:hypothetical protein D9757_007641 [Collybiopsis confluens]|uniref:Uncharacterized protein n=1 Tax=Collybiopsis confluens TaxID=2823264 RepID=A0A8H5M3F7_9AGAR|nr:hypothetical protein D9757_007641 [Collybiopsis confluens]